MLQSHSPHVHDTTTYEADKLSPQQFLKTSNSFGSEDDIVARVVAGLGKPQKTLPTVLLYDEQGSRLFDEITTLSEYYVTRAELEILEHRMTDLASYVGQRAAVVELGSGSSIKAELLLKQIEPDSYTCIDVSESALRSTSHGLRRKFPILKVMTLPADFTKLCALPKSRTALSRLVFFPGSTIGNFEPEKARALLSHLRSLMNEGDTMLVGIDLKKDIAKLNAAYNDSKGITAQFNLNILNHVNHVARASFDPSRFFHRAIYNTREGRMEMHLVSKMSQVVYVNDHMYKIAKNETIHTENSYKYSVNEFIELAQDSRFQIEKTWTDSNSLFSVHLLRVNRYGIH